MEHRPGRNLQHETSQRENQDGGIGRHTAPPRTTRTDKTEQKGSPTPKIKNKHSSRPVGGAETGSRSERTCIAAARLRLAECGTNGAGSLTTSRPCDPTFTHRQTERARLRVAENRAGRVAGSTLRHHIRPQINRTNSRERNRPRNPGLQLGEIKPQTSD